MKTIGAAARLRGRGINLLERRDRRGAVVAMVLACLAHVPAPWLIGTACADIAYDVEVVGVTDPSAQALVEASSQLVVQASYPPPTERALVVRIEDDLPRITDALASMGYWGAVVDYRLEPGTDGRRHVVVAVAEGELYHITEYAIIGANPALGDGTIRILSKDLGLELGSIARSKPVDDSTSRILVALARQGYPLAAIEDRRIVVDHEAHAMLITVRVDTGPFAHFGHVTIQGLESIDPALVIKRLKWHAGEPYDVGKIDATRAELASMGLFSSVEIIQALPLDEAGGLPLLVRLAESKHRSIGAGGTWSTSEGFQGQIAWEHKNTLGAGEHLSLGATAGETEFGMSAEWRKPGVIQPRVAWIASADASMESRNAFKAESVTLALGAEYVFRRTLLGTLGTQYEVSDIRDGGDRDEFVLFGLPVTLIHDTTSDLLDPRNGHRVALGLTPFVELVGPGDGFVTATLSASFYRSLDRSGDTVVAAWSRIGAMPGAGLLDVPANKRFYAGGAGSVRAYGFEDLGAEDASGEPEGGRSLIEGGVELRARLGAQVGVAVFVEGGAVDEDPIPDPSGEFLWGPGIGFRYFTDFGPLRADVAFPANPQFDDENFQIYVGIGQAF